MDLIFYFNVKSRESALSQLVGKSLARGWTVNILTASEAASSALDRVLWETPQTGFLPHCAADADIATQTPIVIDHRPELLQARSVLFNWSGQVPGSIGAYERVVEIVDTDDERRQAARALWRAYAAQGYTPKGHDMQEPSHG
jgi:DNA polymerase-3 subunit chi